MPGMLRNLSCVAPPTPSLVFKSLRWHTPISKKGWGHLCHLSPGWAWLSPSHHSTAIETRFSSVPSRSQSWWLHGCSVPLAQKVPSCFSSPLENFSKCCYSGKRPRLPRPAHDLLLRVPWLNIHKSYRMVLYLLDAPGGTQGL